MNSQALDSALMRWTARIAPVAAVFVGTYFAAESIFPSWVPGSAAAFIAAIFAMIVLASGSAIIFNKLVTFVWGKLWPIWIFGLVWAVLVYSPLRVALPETRETESALMLMSGVVSIIGLIYWRFFRFQHLARDVSVILAIVAWSISFVYVALQGALSRDVLAFAFFSLAITLASASVIYTEPVRMFARAGAGASAAVTVVLTLSVILFSVSPLERGKDRLRDARDSILTPEQQEMIGKGRDYIEDHELLSRLPFSRTSDDDSSKKPSEPKRSSEERAEMDLISEIASEYAPFATGDRNRALYQALVQQLEATHGLSRGAASRIASLAAIEAHEEAPWPSYIDGLRLSDAVVGDRERWYELLAYRPDRFVARSAMTDSAANVNSKRLYLGRPISEDNLDAYRD